jgi:hypothetical protein
MQQLSGLWIDRGRIIEELIGVLVPRQLGRGVVKLEIATGRGTVELITIPC